MIKSMTGFGRCEVAEGKRKFTVEIKSVNHRYLDVNMKMPKKLNFFESAIRNELKTYIQRGKVDLFITLEDYSENNVCIKYNHDVAAEYMKYLQQMAQEFGLDNDVRVSTLSRYPGRVYSRMELVEKVLGYDFEGYERTIDSHVKNLRAKLGDDPRNPKWLYTVHGVGYRFEDPTKQ